MFLSWTAKRVTRLGDRYIHSTSPRQLSFESLDKWIANPPTAILEDSFNIEHTSDLFITLPTRDGTRKPYRRPQVSQALPYGHHLAFFHARKPEHLLREDGTDEEISPPAPFLQRMWAGGRMTWNEDSPLLIGGKARTYSRVGSAVKKGFEKNKPMVFVTQHIDITMEGNDKPSIMEERAHVYLTEDSKRKKIIREVSGIPSKVDFRFQFTPTAITLFRYSALMFNAHHIHLDPVYTREHEGYPVHGPLTATMLLETVAFHNPDARFKVFEYRATNPLIVNRELTINGTWTDDNTAQLWCVDGQGVVGMTGKVVVH